MMRQTDIQSMDKNQASMPPRQRFLRNLEHYIADDQKGDILYDHQKDIFHDTAKFLAAGETRGYIDAPTGTGKTVLFVSLAEAFGYKDDHPPKILVVTPTKDLVHQTQGGIKGDKGFAGFAPNLQVGTFYSDTPTTRKNLEDQITITTYASLKKLAAMSIVTRDADGHIQKTIVNQVNAHYDIIFLDEGHKALGPSTRNIIENLTDDKVIIGFSATPDYTTTRRLDSLLPHMIHRLDLKEAIAMGMLSPVIPYAIDAPAATAYTFTISSTGEYEPQSLRQILYDPARNQTIVELAARFIQAGNTPIIACIPGDAMVHPHLIATQLSELTIVDNDGTVRPIRAQAVTGAMSGMQRQRIYGKLEAGEIDALAYIDVLTEGWDSQRANVIINARPTRSLVAARQRMGRVLRTKHDGRPAVVFDIVDPISATTAPQVSLADIFGLKTLASSQPIGTIAPNFIQPMNELIEQLTDEYGCVPQLTDQYTQYVALVETLPKVTHGQARLEQAGRIRTFATAKRLHNRYGADSFVIDYVTKHDIDHRTVCSRNQIIEAYDETGVHALIADLPDGVRHGNYLTEGDRKYYNLDDVLDIIHRRHNRPNMSYQDLENAIRQQQRSPNNIRLTRQLRAVTHRNVPLYTARTMVELSVIKAVIASLSTQNTTKHIL
ncbi:MAG: DEAD/DEAH box helicase family protein [Candidatus Saccharimonadales bacterium]